MLISVHTMRRERRATVHGGQGTADLRYLVEGGALGRCRMLADMVLEPGASVGFHRHVGESEYYLFLEGRGEADDDGTRVEVGPGDVLVTAHGQGHALVNPGPAPLRFLVLIQLDGEPLGRRRRFFLAGDSTLCTYERALWPRAGWGMALGAHLADDVEVVNAAQSGRSSKSFVDEGHWAALVARVRPGDGVLIQFGHNDEKDDPARHTDPETTFVAGLEDLVLQVVRAGGQPFLATAIERRRFEGKVLVDTHGPWSVAVRNLAPRLGVPLLDLGRETKALYESLGPELTLALFLHFGPDVYPGWPEGCQDDTHLSHVGAAHVASLAARLLWADPRGRGFLPGVTSE